MPIHVYTFQLLMLLYAYIYVGVGIVLILVVSVDGALSHSHATLWQLNLIYVPQERYIHSVYMQCIFQIAYIRRYILILFVFQSARTSVGECPALLPLSPLIESYVLHVNLPQDIQPPLLLRTVQLGSLMELFQQDLFECVICVKDCSQNELRLQASIVELPDDLYLINCTGETVCISTKFSFFCKTTHKITVIFFAKKLFTKIY